MAACQLKLEDYNAAISSCNQVTRMLKGAFQSVQQCRQLCAAPTAAAWRALDQQGMVSPVNGSAFQKAFASHLLQALERDKNNIKALFRRGTAKQVGGMRHADPFPCNPWTPRAYCSTPARLS